MLPKISAATAEKIFKIFTLKTAPTRHRHVTRNTTKHHSSKSRPRDVISCAILLLTYWFNWFLLTFTLYIRYMGNKRVIFARFLEDFVSRLIQTTPPRASGKSDGLAAPAYRLTIAARQWHVLILAPVSGGQSRKCGGSYRPIAAKNHPLLKTQ